MMRKMTVADTNVFARAPRPTQSAYREAVHEIIASVGDGMTDQELADRIGCSSGTVSNARNKKADLSATTLAQIGHEFGPEALQPFADLFGAIIVPAESDEDGVLDDIAEHAAGFVAQILPWRRKGINHTHEGPIRARLKALRSRITAYLERHRARRQARRLAA